MATHECETPAGITALSRCRVRIYRNGHLGRSNDWVVQISELPPDPNGGAYERWVNPGAPARPHLDQLGTEIKRLHLARVVAEEIAWFYAAADPRDVGGLLDRVHFARPHFGSAQSEEWIIRRCTQRWNGTSLLYEDWNPKPATAKLLLSRPEMMTALKRAGNEHPDDEFSGHNVINCACPEHSHLKPAKADIYFGYWLQSVSVDEFELAAGGTVEL
jgi:hypothetical protein